MKIYPEGETDHNYKDGGGVAPVAGVTGPPGATGGGKNCFNLSWAVLDQG